MPYFIAALPPTDWALRITDFIARWDYHPGWPPHITVKAQGGLSEDRAWLGAVAEVCRSFQPFSVSLTEPAMFGESVLFLQVQSCAIGKLHQALVDAVNPSPTERIRYFEDGRFVPHLTLGQVEYGLTTEPLLQMRETVAELRPYPTFTVDQLHVFQLDAKRGTYQRVLDLPLQCKA